jgi:hypothetical protein
MAIILKLVRCDSLRKLLRGKRVNGRGRLMLRMSEVFAIVRK